MRTDDAVLLDFKVADPSGPVSDLLDQLEGQVRSGNTKLKAALSAALIMGVQLSAPLDGSKPIPGLTTEGLGPSHPLGLLLEQIGEKVRNGIITLKSALSSACLMGIEVGPAKLTDIEGGEFKPLVVTP